ncbi:MAG TPA: hypothetical protein VM074_11495 [Solimonas sp.]|nr:hypothetical protein [Solimonas sp.]
MNGVATSYNHARDRPGQPSGFYESFFLRANHPAEPVAFWIRYTVFQPEGHPDQAIGELWAIAFDGRSGRHVAVKQELPIGQCAFAADRFEARIGAAQLAPGHAVGMAESAGHQLRWDLRFGGAEKPVFLLPPDKYAASFPRAKSLVALPNARFDGVLEIDGVRLPVAGWAGSQNHNWGSRHTDRYAWGQVCGFDNAPESFLEVASAKLRIGPLWTPMFTPLVLRHAGREHTLNSIGQSVLRARGRFELGRWDFASENAEVRIEGGIAAPRSAFVGLRYYNPPGGVKHCLNSKLALCSLTITDKRSGAVEKLESANRAAFEILTDDTAHGVALAA